MPVSTTEGPHQDPSLRADEVLSGSWRYDGTVPSRVAVRRSDVAFGTGDADDPPEVQEDREAPCFYVDWYHPMEPSRVVSGSVAFAMLREAIASVRAASQGSVTWDGTPAPMDKIGMALDTLALRPLNGLRHLPHNGTAGWYIWGGPEISQHPDFFQPVHFAHLPELCPQVVDYLALAPGSRFLIDERYEDVWTDASILHV